MDSSDSTTAAGQSYTETYTPSSDLDLLFLTEEWPNLDSLTRGSIIAMVKVERQARRDASRQQQRRAP